MKMYSGEMRENTIFQATLRVHDAFQHFKVENRW